jgi:hypothetical protein
MSQGSINLTDEAFASQRMTALSPITSNRGMHALQSKRAGILANSQLVGKQEVIRAADRQASVSIDVTSRFHSSRDFEPQFTWLQQLTLRERKVVERCLFRD